MSRSIAFTVVFSCALVMGGITLYHPNFSFGAFMHELTESEETVMSMKQSVTFVGDIMLARKVADLSQWHGSDYPWHRLPPANPNAYLVGNFESAIPATYTRTPYFTFSFATPTSSIPALVEYGFTHLSLANNHSYDSGVAGFLHTNETLRAAGLHVFGDAYTVSSSSVAYLDLPKARVGIISISLLNESPPFDVLRSVIQATSQQSDIQIAYVHWGTEYTLIHNSHQRQFAEKLVALGIDAIIGHHPHVIQDVDMLDGVPVFYSLGNFVFDQYFATNVQEGLVLTMHVTEDAVQFYISGVTSTEVQSAPRLMSSEEQTHLLAQIAQKSHSVIAEMVRTGVVVVPR